jgi:hypothetical protein
VDNISCINRTRTNSTIYTKKYRNESGKGQPVKRHSTAPEMVCGNRKASNNQSFYYKGTSSIGIGGFYHPM